VLGAAVLTRPCGQFYLGKAGTGAPTHYHTNPAWNALAFGKKGWVVLPPAHAAFSAVPAAESVAARSTQDGALRSGKLRRSAFSGHTRSERPRCRGGVLCHFLMPPPSPLLNPGASKGQATWWWCQRTGATSPTTSERPSASRKNSTRTPFTKKRGIPRHLRPKDIRMPMYISLV
jgi:hypothetical protein